MADVYTPTLRGRRLALELRRLRDHAGLTVTDAARRCSWDKSKLSRIEQARTGVSDTDLRVLLQMYGLPEERQMALLKLNEDAWQRGWWTLYGGAFTGSFPMLESEAEHIYSYENAFVPGLVQTADYAAEVFRRTITGADNTEINKRVEARMTRKTILTRVQPTQLHLVVDQAAVARRVGDDDVMGGQITELLRVAQLPNVTMQILTFDAGLNAAMAGPFTIFSHPSEPGLDVAYEEGQLGEHYAESAEELARIRLVFQQVSQAALPPEDTRRWLQAWKP